MKTNGKVGLLSDRLLKASIGRCLRCGGLLFVQHFPDLQGEAGEVYYVALRCANCGEVLDRTILRNRSQPAAPSLYGARQGKFAQRADKTRYLKNNWIGSTSQTEHFYDPSD